jgi:HEAT repeat protein
MSSDPSRAPAGLSPDDALPPVEPPSAGFIVQLFVVPGVIVLVVVIIWVLFNWLAQKGNNRDAYVRDLARNNEARWQAATNLALDLRAERDSKNPTLTVDRELARQLAGILETETKEGSLEENPLTLRIYLCRALGEFRVPDGLPALVQAASTVRDPKEADVRRAALEGIALLASNVGPGAKEFAENPKLEEVVLAAGADEDPRTRSVAAVGLGVIGTPAMLDRLRFLLEDANPDVRYNAAVRLAQRGDLAAVPVLVEMLDPTETAGVDAEKNEEMRPFKRALITINALRAVEQLAAANPDADLAQLESAVDKLLASGASGEIRIVAIDLARKLKERSAAPSK